MIRTHILFSASAGGTLKQLLQARAVQDKVVALHEYLDWGPVDCPLADRESWIEAHSPSDVGWDWLAESVATFLETARLVRRPLIWIAPQNANELSGFYWYLDQVRPHEADMMIVDFPVHGGWRDEPPRSLGELSIERFADVFDRPIERWDSNRFAPSRWPALVSEAALLRVVSKGQLRSAPSSFFDEILLQCCPMDWTRWYRVVGDAMGRSWDAGHNPDDSLLKWRLLELIDGRRVELDGDLSLHSVAQAAKIRRIG